MQFWMEFFSIVAAIALMVQVGILTALFLQLKRTTESINRVVNDLHSRLGPILTRTQFLLDDTQPKISTMVDDASHIVYLARGQAQKLDRVFTDATDRLRGQLVHADRILTGTLEAVEDAGSKCQAQFLAAGAEGVGDWCRESRLGWICCGRAEDVRRRENHAEQEEELFI